MQITFNPAYSYKPGFTSNTRTVRNKSGQLLYRNTTNFFRSDLNWKEFGNFIKEKYKNVDKVNIFNYACSDGSESMSLVILLKELLGADSEKFLPVIAKDIDSTVIYMANSNYVNMDYSDYEAINKLSGGNFGKYFVFPMGGIGIEADSPVRVRPELNGQIKYSTADIRQDIQNIPDKNTILFCRNFWPYIKDGRAALVQKLAKNLQNNGLLVTGNYDNTVELPELLSLNGFKRVKDLSNVYEIK